MARNGISRREQTPAEASMTILFLPALYALCFRRSLDAASSEAPRADSPRAGEIRIWIKKTAARIADRVRGLISRPKPHVASLVLAALVLSAVVGATSAAERGTAEQRRACTPDVFKHCSEFIPDADRITVCLRQKVRELSPECRVVMTGLKKAEATVGQAPRNAGRRE